MCMNDPEGLEILLIYGAHSLVVCENLEAWTSVKAAFSITVNMSIEAKSIKQNENIASLVITDT